MSQVSTVIKKTDEIIGNLVSELTALNTEKKQTRSSKLKAALAIQIEKLSAQINEELKFKYTLMRRGI